MTFVIILAVQIVFIKAFALPCETKFNASENCLYHSLESLKR